MKLRDYQQDAVNAAIAHMKKSTEANELGEINGDVNGNGLGSDTFYGGGYGDGHEYGFGNGNGRNTGDHRQRNYGSAGGFGNGNGSSSSSSISYDFLPCIIINPEMGELEETSEG